VLYANKLFGGITESVINVA